MSPSASTDSTSTPEHGWRRLGRRDAEEVARLETASFTEPWTRPMVEQELGSEHCFALGLVDRRPNHKDLLSAHALFRTVPPTAELNRIAVAPEDRRQGLGRVLLGQALGQLAKASCREVFLEVRSNNKAALALYRALGFMQVGCRSGYYTDGTDALVLRCVLKGLST